MSEELNRRNIEAMSKQMADLDAMIRETRAMINGLNVIAAQLHVRITTLENSRRVQALGHGPTVTSDADSH